MGEVGVHLSLVYTPQKRNQDPSVVIAVVAAATVGTGLMALSAETGSQVSCCKGYLRETRAWGSGGLSLISEILLNHNLLPPRQ